MRATNSFTTARHLRRRFVEREHEIIADHCHAHLGELQRYPETGRSISRGDDEQIWGPHSPRTGRAVQRLLLGCAPVTVSTWTS